jgi:hypothetical protein
MAAVTGSAIPIAVMERLDSGGPDEPGEWRCCVRGCDYWETSVRFEAAQGHLLRCHPDATARYRRVLLLPLEEGNPIQVYDQRCEGEKKKKKRKRVSATLQP